MSTTTDPDREVLRAMTGERSDQPAPGSLRVADVVIIRKRNS